MGEQSGDQGVGKQRLKCNKESDGGMSSGWREGWVMMEDHRNETEKDKGRRGEAERRI